MCGIVAYIGKRSAEKIIVKGLSVLEYRGYDSAGIAVVSEKGIRAVKKSGKLEKLKEALADTPTEGNIGIGHTRWATHGEPTDRNAHPHCDRNDDIAVVHNGIIENYAMLKEELIAKGVPFRSETDTEVIAHLIGEEKGSLTERVRNVLPKLRGSYALAILSAEEPETLVITRRECPLVVGIGEEEYVIASDVTAVLPTTREVIFLENGDLMTFDSTGCRIEDAEGNSVERQSTHIEWTLESAGKEGYEHFMLKEIHEQPNAVAQTLRRRLLDDGTISLGTLNWSGEKLQSFRRFYIVGCGTAYHAGMVGRKMLEQLLRQNIQCELASEFRYADLPIDEHTLVIAVSQSGETADTVAAVREAKNRGATIFSITNVIGSTLARESDDVFFTWAGPEISVASTKAYTTQLTAFALISLTFALRLGTVSREVHDAYLRELEALPEKMEMLLQREEELREHASELAKTQGIFYLGRGMDYISALEGALKMKELTYIFTEAFPAGELKHGPIALIEKGTPVIVIATQTGIFEKTLSNMEEVISRGAKVLLFKTDAADRTGTSSATVFDIPASKELLMPILSILPLQLISYYASVSKGLDVDKPRNLAKSVTVE